MKKLFSIALAFYCVSFLSAQEASEKLDSIISKIEDYKAYDREKFPLGLYTKEYYKEESEFAEKQLEQLQDIKIDSLNETEQISLEMLKFKLQETIDRYKYESYLNPLLSDSGFHLSLAYQVRDLNNYAEN